MAPSAAVLWWREWPSAAAVAATPAAPARRANPSTAKRTASRGRPGQPAAPPDLRRWRQPVTSPPHRRRSSRRRDAGNLFSPVSAAPRWRRQWRRRSGCCPARAWRLCGRERSAMPQTSSARARPRVRSMPMRFASAGVSGERTANRISGNELIRPAAVADNASCCWICSTAGRRWSGQRAGWPRSA